MKEQSDKTVVPCRTVDLTHCTLPAQYAMRTECSADSIVIKAALASWVTMWREDSIFLPNADGVSWRLPDLDVVFSLQAAAPGLNQLRWLIDSLMDCHVAAQTLMLRDAYTGERLYDELDELLERPSNVALEEVQRNLRFGKKYLRGTGSRMDYAVKRFDEPETTVKQPGLALGCPEGTAKDIAALTKPRAERVNKAVEPIVV